MSHVQGLHNKSKEISILIKIVEGEKLENHRKSSKKKSQGCISKKGKKMVTIK